MPRLVSRIKLSFGSDVQQQSAGTRERPVPADFPHDATSTISIARKKTAITLDGGFLNVR
jgi:hypothetical protein